MKDRTEAASWLDAGQIARIRHAFAHVARNADGFTVDFYARLFELEPATRALFPDDLSDQRAKLVRTLVMLVGNLDHPEELRPLLAGLGSRHRSYGVLPTHYPLVGQALIATLAASLGDSFTAVDRSSWAALYEHIANIMISGTARPAAPV